MKGFSVDNFKEENPSIVSAYEDYAICRILTLTEFIKPTKDGNKKYLRIPWPAGFTVLPKAGGVDDQDHRTLRLFGAFLAGERDAARSEFQ